MNRICIVGRMTRDPEVRYTQSGKPYATFAVAVNKRIKPKDSNERDADFFNVTAWGHTADFVGNYLGKGRLVSVEGRMESRRYTDRDGNSREGWAISADSVSGLDRPRDDAGPNDGNAPPATTEDQYDPFADE